MQKIVTHLWYDKEAKEAAAFYASLFEGSAIKNVTTLHGTPSGDADIVTVDLAGQEFMLISAGPYFTFTPAVSLLVSCATKEEVDALWTELLKGGAPLMEIGAYPFSERYGWLKDKYGLSWQIMYVGEHALREGVQKIVPMLLFVGAQCGKAEEAMRFYASIFPNASVGDIMRYGAESAPDKEGTVKNASFTLEGMRFTAMDSAHRHDFTFNEAVSFIVRCETQEEIDKYWEALSADPAAEQCGWLKDEYGLSWQIVPTIMDEMFKSGDAEKMARVTEAFLKMKKFDIAALTAAFEGR